MPAGAQATRLGAVTAIVDRPRVLADVIPGGLARDAALVLGGAGFVGLLAQWAITLPFTPVPLTLGTFAVLLTGAALGTARGLASIGIYVAAGMAGVPWFAGHSSGWGFPSFGYLIALGQSCLLGRLYFADRLRRGRDPRRRARRPRR